MNNKLINKSKYSDVRFFDRYYFHNLKLAIIIVPSLILCGCGLNQLDQYEAYTYQYNASGCDTGKHSFSDRISMCNALKNNSLNNNCALTERQSKFNTDCYDQSWF